MFSPGHLYLPPACRTRISPDDGRWHEDPRNQGASTASCTRIGEIPRHRCAIRAARRQLRTAEYAQLNPHRKVPTLVDGDHVLWEFSAMVAYQQCIQISKSSPPISQTLLSIWCGLTGQTPLQRSCKHSVAIGSQASGLPIAERGSQCAPSFPSMNIVSANAPISRAPDAGCGRPYRSGKSSRRVLAARTGESPFKR